MLITAPQFASNTALQNLIINFATTFMAVGIISFINEKKLKGK
jgi:hypothetical protein